MKCYILIIISCISCSLQAWSWKSAYTWAYTPKKTAIFSKKYPTTSTCFFELGAQEGNIEIKSWNKPFVLVEAHTHGPHEDVDATQIVVEKSTRDHVIIKTQQTKHGAHVRYNIHVPAQAHVTVHAEKGSVELCYPEGPTAVTINQGPIHIKLRTIAHNGSLFAHTGQGDIILHSPTTLNAQLHAKTDTGTVTSQLYITLNPQTVLWNTTTWDHFKKELDGILGDGGGPITLETVKGNISVVEQ